MLFFSFVLISFFIKFIFFYKCLLLKILEKKIKALLFFFLSYDIMTDFVYFMYDAEAELRPWWFNIFCGTSLFYFLAKIHGFRYFCIKVFEDKNYSKKKENFFWLLSFFLALPRFIFYTYFCIKENFIREIVPSFLRYKGEIYITYFAGTIYPLILLFNPIKSLHEKLKNIEIPILIKKASKTFLYFGIIPRIFLDFIQTSTWKYIQNFLFENGKSNYPLYSHVTTEVVCILTTFYFLITYFFAKKIEKILNFDQEKNKDLESIEDLKKEEFIIDIKSITEKSNNEFTIKDIVDSFIKKTVSKILKVPIEYINVDLSNQEENIYLSEISNSNKNFENYIKKNSIVLLDEIEAFLFLSKNEIENEKLIPIKDFLKKNNIDAFFSFKSGDNIDGVIIIEKQSFILEEKNYNEENIEKIIYLLEQIKIFKKNFNHRKNLDIVNFKSKKLEDFAKYITNVHENIILNLNNTFLKVKSHFLIFQKKRIKWLSEEKPDFSKNLEDLIKKKYYSEYLIKDTKPIIHREKNHTFIINKIKENKNDIFSIFVFPFSFVDFNQHKFMLTFTETGKKINELIPGNNNLFFEYKNKLISILSEYRPNILIYENTKIDYTTNIFKKIEDIECLKYSYKELNNENYIKEVFNSKINEFLEKSLKKLFIIINGFEKINSNFQKLILEEYIKKEDKIFKEKKVKLKIIFIISSIQDLTYLNSDIINISMIYDLSSIKIKDILQDEKEKFIEKICNNILDIKISTEQAIGVFNIIKEQIEDFSFYNFIQFLENYFSEYKKDSNIPIESYVQKAIMLGKNSLKDPELMFSLAKIYNSNYSKLAKTLGIHKSSVSRFFKNYKQSNDINI